MKVNFWARLREALGVTAEEIQTAKDRVRAGQWTLKGIAVELESLLVVVSASDSVATVFGSSPELDTHDDADLKVFLSRREVEARRPCATNTYLPFCAMPPRVRDRTHWFKGPMPALHFVCHMCEAEYPN